MPSIIRKIAEAPPTCGAFLLIHSKLGKAIAAVLVCTPGV